MEASAIKRWYETFIEASVQKRDELLRFLTTEDYPALRRVRHCL
jgi:hypothetical protein